MKHYLNNSVNKRLLLFITNAFFRHFSKFAWQPFFSPTRISTFIDWTTSIFSFLGSESNVGVERNRGRPVDTYGNPETSGQLDVVKLYYHTKITMKLSVFPCPFLQLVTLNWVVAKVIVWVPGIWRANIRRIPSKEHQPIMTPRHVVWVPFCIFRFIFFHGWHIVFTPDLKFIYHLRSYHKCNQVLLKVREHFIGSPCPAKKTNKQTKSVINLKVLTLTLFKKSFVFLFFFIFVII